MPRLNSQGQAVCGVGSGPISVDGRALNVNGGGPASWLTDTTLIANTPVNGVWDVVALDATSGAVVSIILPGGANSVAAGGGNWLAWRSTDGLHGSFGTLPQAGIRGAGLDGTLAYVPSYQQGIGIDLVAPDGTIVSVAGAVVHDSDYALQVLGHGQAVWWTGSGTGVVGVQAPAIALPAGAIRRCLLPDGEVWWVYSTADKLVAQLDGATDGYILSIGGTSFHHDAVVVNGQIVIAWSVTGGEAPGDLVKRVLDLTQPRYPLVTPPPVIPTFTFTHPVLVAPYFDAAGASAAPAEILANDQAQQTARPCFSTPGTVPRGTDLGLYAEMDTLLPVPLQRRVLLVHDGTGPWIPPRWLRAFDLVGLECYRVPSETLDQSVARWTSQLQDLLALVTNDLALVPMFYTQNTQWTIGDTLDAIRPLSALVNLSPRVIVIAPFAYSRADGITAHVELQETYANLLTEQRRVGIAPLPPLPGPTPPPIVQGDLLTMFATIDPTKIVIAYSIVPSKATPGCFNLTVDAAGTIFSAHGDTRPPGTDGAWEAGQPTGAGVYTFWADGKAWPYGVVLVDKLPK